MAFSAIARLVVIALMAAYVFARHVHNASVSILKPRQEKKPVWIGAENPKPKDPWEVHPAVCHNEKDFPKHPDISPKHQGEIANEFCNHPLLSIILTKSEDPALRNYAQPFLFSWRKHKKKFWRTEKGCNYDFHVSWAEGCTTRYDFQNIQHPLGRDRKWCFDLMRENFKNCNNGGVGGKTQAGCIIYDFQGGKWGHFREIMTLDEQYFKPKILEKGQRKDEDGTPLD
ncbi:hypothetical protein CCHL11_06862 [Colletotrichum chlorophyti]|uniref:Uncharacterized protein n=1 Tax=Colletotrichum chlorophyti TaxID=708187 RepID=A0A1Q8S9F5_9PEZI|nr:hypothetical protein CCHL11_06862 [Colletotrichum chlorophyti]